MTLSKKQKRRIKKDIIKITRKQWEIMKKDLGPDTKKKKN